MYYFFIFLLLHSSVASICDICACRYIKEIDQDFLGESVDCSYRDLSVTNYSLPSTVRSLDLSSNGISNLQSTTLFKSRTMTELTLSSNKIKEIQNVFELPELKRLDLSDNFIYYIDQDTFRSIKQLEYLNLANNKLTTFAKLTFHHLRNLQDIVLDNNNIGPSLKEINLFDRNGFGLTHKITGLSISGINLNLVPENFFVDAYQLKTLVISNNNISDIFEIPYTLEYLDLSDNPIKQISTEDFSDLPALTELKLNNLKIKEVPDYVFAPLHGLVSLELERNKNLTVFSRLAFGREVLDDADDFTLEVLSLRGSRITRLDKQLIEPFSRLTELDLQGNPWICDCNLVWIKELQIPSNSYEYLRCFSPKPFFNAKIFELDAKYFSCPRDRKSVGGVIAVVTLCVMLSAIALWFFFFLPRYQTRSTFISELFNPSTSYTVLPMNVIK